MRESHNDSTQNRPGGTRFIDAPLVSIDIPSTVMQLRKEKAWKTNDRNSITIYKTDSIRIVLLSLHKHREMQTKHPDNVLTIHLLSGKLKLQVETKTVILKKDQLLALHEQVPYSIFAKRKSLFLLTIVI